MATIHKTDIDLNKNQILNARLHNTATTPSSPAVGQIIYNTTLGTVLIWNGTTWLDPFGGSNIYNTDGQFTGNRKILMSGSNSTDTFTISDSSNTVDYLKVIGTGIVELNKLKINDINAVGTLTNLLAVDTQGNVSKTPWGMGIPLIEVLLADNVTYLPIVLDYTSLVFDQSDDSGGKIHLMGTEGFDAGTYYQELQNKSGTIALLSDIEIPNLDTVVSVDGSVYSSPIYIYGDMFKFTNIWGLGFTTLNSDNTSNTDRTQTLQDKDGIIALLSDIQEPGLIIEDILYLDLMSLKNGNSLVKGTRYFISDREIWIDALDSNKLAMECKRHFRIVKDELYTPHVVSGFFTSNYLGIYGQTIAKGSVPNNTLTGNRYYAIWGGRMWGRDTIGSDVPGTSNETIAGGWTMFATTNDTYYESKIFDIKYDFDEDLIWEQSDDRGNKIKRQSNTTSYIDITDWGNTNIYNNENQGIYNNFMTTSTKAAIYYNSNSGAIYNNSNSGAILLNSNSGNIYNNTNVGPIHNNTNRGNIQNNSNSGNIYYNSNSGNINNNLNSGYIQYNSNSGYINSNSCGNIYYNTNRGNIQYNTNNGVIYMNSNSGYIQYNTSSGSTTFNIRYNINNGYIQRNNSTSNIVIQYNINNGNIGPGSGATNRSTTIQDTQVNK